MSHSLCHPCNLSYSYRFNRVTTYENCFSQLFCEVRSVSFLKPLNNLRKYCLDVNMKQINEVGIESDR